MAFIEAKAIKVYYNKGDRKPYDANGKPLSYLGQDNIGANIATQVRFYLGEDLAETITPIVVSKRADGERHFDILTEGTDTEVTPNQKYYYVNLSNWYSEKVGKLTMALKVYSGTVTIVDGEITASTGRIVVSDIFHVDIAYAPDASDLVPPFDPDYYEELLEALANKVERQEVIQVVNTLPSVTNDDNGKWFLVRQTNGGRLYRVLGGVAVEVETEMGKVKLTPTGNGDVTTNTGRVLWSQPNGTLELGVYNDVVLHLGEDSVYYGKASATITKGDIIQFAGYEGDHALIKPAVASEINANAKLIMGIAKQNIANNEFGYVSAFGKIESIDTKGFNAGTLIWFDSSGGSGGWSSVMPTAPNAKVLVGVVVKAESSSPANNGVILVRPTFEPKLGDLQDVLIGGTPTQGDVLRYDSGVWTNSNTLTTAETDIDTLQSDVLGLDNTKADITYVDSQDTALENRIEFIETNGGIDFIKVANYASLPSSGDVRNHRLYMTIDTKQLWEWDGTQWNESSPTDLSDINVTATSGNIAMTITGDETQDESILRINDGDNNLVADMNGTGDLTLWKNLTVDGNLTVNGTTTTIDTETVAIEDNIILINKNQTGTPPTTLKGGLEVERGNETNFQFVFDESDDRFKVGQVGSLQTVATRQDDGTMVDKGVPFFNATTNRLETTTNLKVNASGQLEDTTIRNSTTSNVPLIVNGIASTSADLQRWSINNDIQSKISSIGLFFTYYGVANFTDVNRSYVNTGSNGTVISRDIADANSALRVNQVNASSTGNIANFQWQGTNRLEITRDGFLTQNGTRLFTQTGGTTNTFFGTTSGGTATTGINNTSFGGDTLKALTSGQANVAVGRNALSSLTTSNENVAVGISAGNAIATANQNTVVGAYSFGVSTASSNTGLGYATGLTITTGTNNTFVGHNSGNNASQLATASNSTAIGNGSYTDASNQMVFGNASVTQFKFDRNTSAEVILPRITASTSGIASFERTTTETNTSGSVVVLKRTTTNDMVDGFGPNINFQIKDNANVDNTIATIRALRSGADNSGRLAFETVNAGVFGEKMTIMPNGNVGIGATPFTARTVISGTDGVTLSGVTPTNVAFQISNVNTNYGMLFGTTGGGHGLIQQRRTDTTETYYNLLLQPHGGRVGIGLGTAQPDTTLHVGGIINLTNNLTWFNGNADINGADTNLKFRTYTGSALTEKMRITGAGNVGIGTTSPSQLLTITGGDILINRSTSNQVNSGTIRIAEENWQGGFINYDGSANKFFIGTHDANDTNSANDLQVITLLRNGNSVGIGEISPTAQLQVKSGSTTRVPLIVDTLASHTANLQEWRLNGSAFATMASNGDLFALGMSNVASGNNSRIRLNNNNTTISRNVNDANPTLIVNQVHASSTGDIAQFQFGGSTKLAITKDGDLKENTNTIFIDTAGSTAISHGANDANTGLFIDHLGTGSFVEARDSSQDTVFEIQNDGDVYNTNGTYGTISDIRVKENIVEARNYLEDLMKLRVVKYSLKDEHATEANKLGFIAQEFEQVFPSMVSTSEKGDIKDFKSIKTSVLIPMLVKVIQELKKEIDELKGK